MVVTELLRAVLTDPTVLVLEDADAADDASADLLRRFTARLADRPVLFLVTKREPGTGFVPAPGAATTLRLQPLDPGARARARPGHDG